MARPSMILHMCNNLSINNIIIYYNENKILHSFNSVGRRLNSVKKYRLFMGLTFNVVLI